MVNTQLPRDPVERKLTAQDISGMIAISGRWIKDYQATQEELAKAPLPIRMHGLLAAVVENWLAKEKHHMKVLVDMLNQASGGDGS